LFERWFAELTRKVWSAAWSVGVFVMRLQKLTFEERLEPRFDAKFASTRPLFTSIPATIGGIRRPLRPLPISVGYLPPEPALEGFADRHSLKA
jgi:hypothetical protein